MTPMWSRLSGYRQVDCRKIFGANKPWDNDGIMMFNRVPCFVLNDAPVPIRCCFFDFPTFQP